MSHSIVEVLKVVVLVSILFVWVIRYQNIIQEFKHYDYPEWLRDLVGISKITCAVLMLSSNVQLVQWGALGLAALMICALYSHFKVKNPPLKMLPALTLLTFSLIIFFSSQILA